MTVINRKEQHRRNKDLKFLIERSHFDDKTHQRNVETEEVTDDAVNLAMQKRLVLQL